MCIPMKNKQDETPHCCVNVPTQSCKLFEVLRVVPVFHAFISDR